ncbi:MAG: hypothetical protein COA45_09195 [Zetaproteobacteria bacterium]|nr:MAG: hypothetical protein COA45_09195 [Zetaproteobacteria bacterium]
MKFYTRVAFLFLAFALFPVSFSYAEDATDAEQAEVLTLEEARHLVGNLPTARDAVTGVVPTKSKEFYDIYGRQIAFREGAKELRASLDERRENFSAPNVEALEGYRDTVKKVYTAEAVAYQASEVEDSEDDTAAAQEDEESMMVSVDVSDDADTIEDVPVSEEEAASVDDVEEPGLMEKMLPSDSVEEGTPKKKVVTSDDAPEFDPADL